MALTILMALLLTSCHKETNNNSSTENPRDDHYTENPRDDHYANQQYPPTAQVIRKAVTDIDGNIYDAVQIGDQVWMAENLRTTRYADGTCIPVGTGTSTIMSYRYYPDGDDNNVSTYGYLYNWSAVMYGDSSSIANPSGVQGICPNGWHIPSLAEWRQLSDYVSSQTQYQCNNSIVYIAKALASTTGWSSSTMTCAVGNNPSDNNATGFSALPAGGYFDIYDFFGNYAAFYSATEFDDNYPYSYILLYNGANVNISDGFKENGLSVRCVRD